MARAGKETDRPLPRPCLHMTRAVHRASLVKNTSQRGRVIELTGQFPVRESSLGLWLGAGQLALWFFFSHLKHFAESRAQGRDSVQMSAD